MKAQRKPYFQRFIQAHDNNGVIKTLIEAGITSEKRIRNYMIIQDFYHYLIKKKWKIYRIYWQLSEQYGLSEKQVFNIVHKWRNKFKIQ